MHQTAARRGNGPHKAKLKAEVKKTTDPPRLAICLLTRRLSVEWRDFIVGDLREGFGTRRGDSPVAAYAWFWWQTMRCLAAPPPVRPNPLRQGSSPGDTRMRTVFADLRYAFRVMSRRPSYAAAVVSVLALGIGANTAKCVAPFHAALSGWVRKTRRVAVLQNKGILID
jgi:hypothetical protein